jgi:arabinan endo-1,5-alpha-L-arabinosidase
LIRSSAPRYVLFRTPDNTEHFSQDRVTWTPGVAGGPAPPAWWADAPLGATVAPDVSYHKGKYWMYYSRSPTFGAHAAAIGLATSPTADPGTWLDAGKIIASTDSSTYRALDPNLFVDTNGKWYVVFGSFFAGIFIKEADSNTGKLLPWAGLVNIAARPTTDSPLRAIEAPFMFKRGGYYYLFVSFDFCCPQKQPNGPRYNIRVGRSTSPTGPFAGPAGTDMRDGGGGLLLAGHDNVVGPGGQSVVHDPIKNEDLLVYHYNDAGNAPTLGLNRLGWDANGWPYVY